MSRRALLKHVETSFMLQQAGLRLAGMQLPGMHCCCMQAGWLALRRWCIKIHNNRNTAVLCPTVTVCEASTGGISAPRYAAITLLQ